MFEVIWSVFEDKYIVRNISAFSSIHPRFIGNKQECIAYIKYNLN